jgi:GAF domain-containing protein
MTITRDPSADLVALVGVALAHDDLSSALTEICRIAGRAVSGADGATVTTLSDGRPTAVASDDWSKGFDELQYAQHEGPCLDAYRTGNAFRVRDLADEPRWPSYVPLALERGGRSMMSLPMAAEGKLIGALNLYARAPNAFDAEDMSFAEVIAGHAGLACQVSAALFGHRELAEQMAEAMRSRAVIEQAKGILMGSRRCSADAAFDVLVQTSQGSNRKLRDVAQALVTEAEGSAPS